MLVPTSRYALKGVPWYRLPETGSGQESRYLLRKPFILKVPSLTVTLFLTYHRKIDKNCDDVQCDHEDADGSGEPGDDAGK